MALIDWKDEYSVGVYKLDSDHKKLFGFVSKYGYRLAERSYSSDG